MTVILPVLLLFSISLLIVLLILQRYLSYRFEQELLFLIQKKQSNRSNQGRKPMIQTNRTKYWQDMQDKAAFAALESEKAKYVSKKSRRSKKEAPHYPLFNSDAANEEEKGSSIFGSSPTSFLSYTTHAERYIDRHREDENNITSDFSVVLESTQKKKPVDPSLAVISIEEILNFRKKRSAQNRSLKVKTAKNSSNSATAASLKKVDLGDFERKAIDEAIDDYYVKRQRAPLSILHKEPVKKKAARNNSLKGEIIDSEEIKNNLLRLRSQRRREKNYFSCNNNEEIEVGEVKENLRGSDSPLVRSRQLYQTAHLDRASKITDGKSILPSAVEINGQIKKGVLSSRFTPMDNSESENTISISSEHKENIEHTSSYGRKRHHFLAQEEEQQETSLTLTSNSEEANDSDRDIQTEVKEQICTDLDLANCEFPAEEGYHRPPLALLEKDRETEIPKEPREEVLRRGALIENKLAEFKVKVKVTDAYAGPVVTRYDIEPDVGVRGNQVINLEKDLARALGCASVRIVDTIPGKTCMGLELPNNKRKIIRLSEIFASPVFQDSKAKLTLALGEDITGAPIVTDLTKAPHLLVAGTTGSGKSVGINAMILSLLYKESPERVRLVMIDPKMLELNIYEGIPHLLAPVVTDMKMAANALMWCVNEMEKRYRIMSQLGVRNIVGYNQKLKSAALQGKKIGNPFSLTPDQPEPLEPFPYIVVVVDEFADMMMTTGKKVEELIARLAQKARAAGIHLILATQRPSVDVITGLIKASVPSRVSFQVSSKVDSRTILDQAGAENLLGMGDMLFSHGSGFPLRVHGAFVADEEVHRVVDFLKAQGEPEYIDEILNPAVGFDDNNEGNRGDKDAEEDPLYDEAVAVVLDSGKASISFVQRALRIGYNRAARLIEEMENSGIVSRPENNGNRTILVPRSRQEG